MIANTRSSPTFTHHQFRGWLSDAGFVDIAVVEPVRFNEIILAT
jgi:hypothetical protein